MWMISLARRPWMAFLLGAWIPIKTLPVSTLMFRIVIAMMNPSVGSRIIGTPVNVVSPIPMGVMFGSAAVFMLRPVKMFLCVSA